MVVRKRHKTGVNNLRNNPNRIYRIDEAIGRSAPVVSPEKRKELILKQLERNRKKREALEPLNFSFLYEDDE